MEKQEAELAQLRQASGVVVQDDHEGLPPKALPRLDGRKVGAEEIAAALSPYTLRIGGTSADRMRYSGFGGGGSCIE